MVYILWIKVKDKHMKNMLINKRDRRGKKMKK